MTQDGDRGRTGVGDRPCLPAAIIREVAGLWQGRLSAASPELAGPAARLLSRIRPPSWALEWSLPYWLGMRLGLDRAVWQPLILANVAGLGYVRLQDDLLDGENGSASGDRALLAAVHDLWLRILLEQLGDRPRFWDLYETWMADWLVATALEPVVAYDTAAGLQRLADRGAPLKICVAAACELSGERRRAGEIAGAVDTLLSGAVLFDHVLDWEEDLARRRYNAFLAAYGWQAGEADAGGSVRRSVARDFIMGGAARSYFNLIGRQLASAERRAAAAGVADLAQFARWLGCAANAHRTVLAKQAHARWQEALGQLPLRSAARHLG